MAWILWSWLSSFTWRSRLALALVAALSALAFARIVLGELSFHQRKYRLVHVLWETLQVRLGELDVAVFGLGNLFYLGFSM